MALAAGAALALALGPDTQAQPSEPGTAQRETVQAQGVAPERLSPDQIRQIQQALKDQGFYRGAVDGAWRAESAAALRRFRSVRPGFEGSTPKTGADRIDRETLSALGLDPAKFGQDEPYTPSGPTGRRGSSAPPRTAPGAPPSGTQPGAPGLSPNNTSPGGPAPRTSPGTSPGSR
jgi:hypothetical protein